MLQSQLCGGSYRHVHASAEPFSNLCLQEAADAQGHRQGDVLELTCNGMVSQLSCKHTHFAQHLAHASYLLFYTCACCAH